MPAIGVIGCPCEISEVFGSIEVHRHVRMSELPGERLGPHLLCIACVHACLPLYTWCTRGTLVCPLDVRVPCPPALLPSGPLLVRAARRACLLLLAPHRANLKHVAWVHLPTLLGPTRVFVLTRGMGHWLPTHAMPWVWCASSHVHSPMGRTLIDGLECNVKDFTGTCTR